MYELANVSVVIPCYKCSDTIERAVCSVAKQTLKPYEVILVDDFSGDGTLDLLHAIKNNYEEGWVKVIASTKNGGAGTARNIGWRAATQTYIAFLDSDDTWREEKIEIQYNWMISNPEVVLTGHAFQYTSESDESTQGITLASKCMFSKITQKQLLYSNPFPTPSVMLRRDLKPRFVDGKRYCEDYQLWLEICCDDLNCYYSPLPLAYIHKAAYGEAGLSSALWRMQKGEMQVYSNIYKAGKINFFKILSLYAWSLFKFSVRVVRSCFRRISRAI